MKIAAATMQHKGRYECRAKNTKDPNNQVKKSTIVVVRPRYNPSTSFTSSTLRQSCDDNHEKDYCLNNGKCYMLQNLDEYLCE